MLPLTIGGILLFDFVACTYGTVATMLMLLLTINAVLLFVFVACTSGNVAKMSLLTIGAYKGVHS